MRKSSIWLYCFDDLSPVEQQKAIAALRHSELIGGWWLPIFEQAKSIHFTLSGFDPEFMRVKGNLDGGVFDTAEEIIRNPAFSDTDLLKIANFWFAVFEASWPLHSFEESGLEYEDTEFYKMNRRLFESQITRYYQRLLSEEAAKVTSDEQVADAIRKMNIEFDQWGEIQGF